MSKTVPSGNQAESRRNLGPTAACGALRWRTYTSLATRGTQMKKFLQINPKKSGEETDGMEAERGQPQSPQTPVAPPEKEEKEVTAPGDTAPSTSVAGGQPNQEETAPNSEGPAQASVFHKRVCGSYRKKLKRLRKEAEGNLTPPSQLSKEKGLSREDNKRKKDTPPSAPREDKRPRKTGGRSEATGVAGTSGVAQKGATGSVGLTVAQRTNPLTVVATAEEYPDTLLSQEDFSSLRASFRCLAKETPPAQMPRIETSFGKGGVFVFVASDERSKEWLLNKVATLDYGGPKLKVGGVELIQKLYKATVWLPGPPEEPAEVMSRLEAYNPTLKTCAWRSIKVTPHAKDSGRQDAGDKYVLVFQLPESQVRALETLDNRPWMELGRVTFKVSYQAPEGDKVEAMATDQA